MKRFNDYFRRARFLLPSLFLMALISFSVTISSVQSTAEVNREAEKVLPRRQPAASATPTTAEVCTETKKVLDQLEREYFELLRTRSFKEEERSYRNSLSDLDKAIATGSLLDMRELEFLLSSVTVELPKHKIGLNKTVGEMTVQERSALQRTLRPVIRRELEEAANTTLDRLEDRINKNGSQRNLREQRLKDLNCAKVLKGETDETDETPDISGTWNYGSYVYTITKKEGSTFTWKLAVAALKETATGTIKGKSVSATVTNVNGRKDLTGTVTQVDGSGRATRIEWTNGVVFTR